MVPALVQAIKIFREVAVWLVRARVWKDDLRRKRAVPFTVRSLAPVYHVLLDFILSDQEQGEDSEI